MASPKVNQVQGKLGRKIGYLVYHKACGTQYWRTKAMLKVPEQCGVCLEKDVKLSHVTK